MCSNFCTSNVIGHLSGRLESKWNGRAVGGLVALLSGAFQGGFRFCEVHATPESGEQSRTLKAWGQRSGPGPGCDGQFVLYNHPSQPGWRGKSSRSGEGWVVRRFAPCSHVRESFPTRSSEPLGRHSVRINLFTILESRPLAGFTCRKRSSANTISVIVSVENVSAALRPVFKVKEMT